MGVITFLVILAVIVATPVVVVSLKSAPANWSRHSENKALRNDLRTAKIALRHIASNAAGNPILEAQLALEEIEGRELKELE